MTAPNELALEARGLAVEVPGRRLFSGVDLCVHPREMIAITGPSGVGKTSLLNALAGITQCKAETLRVCGADLLGMSGEERASVRLGRIGLVFQFAELLPELSVVENVALPLRLRGLTRGEAERRARARLNDVGLETNATRFPDGLSGGERQRVAVARALVGDPALVLADEPTGSLDRDTALRIARLLADRARCAGVAVVIATHDRRVASTCDRSAALDVDGLHWGDQQ